MTHKITQFQWILIIIQFNKLLWEPPVNRQCWTSLGIIQQIEGKDSENSAMSSTNIRILLERLSRGSYNWIFQLDA